VQRGRDIDRFIHGPSVFPSGFLSHPANRAFRRALASVLVQLPADIYAEVERETIFLFDSRRAKMAACSIAGGGKVIVIFERGLKTYSELGLSGLLVHEIAHGFLENGHAEGAADELARQWGFGCDIDARNSGGG